VSAQLKRDIAFVVMFFGAILMAIALAVVVSGCGGPSSFEMAPLPGTETCTATFDGLPLLLVLDPADGGTLIGIAWGEQHSEGEQSGPLAPFGIALGGQQVEWAPDAGLTGIGVEGAVCR
jgi:hypothetical protein